MRYSFLGGTGLKVSEFCLGTINFGTSTSAEESQKIWKRCIDAEVNFFDTADAAPVSEELLGKFSRHKRHSLVISTKVFQPTASGPNGAGLSRKHIVLACEASLRRLQTDYIDLYLAHSDDYFTPIEETLSAFDQLVRQGKVLYLGASNYTAWRLNEALWIALTRNYSQYCCLQALYNLHERDIETELLPMCQQKGVGIVAWSPLARGALTDAVDNGIRDVDVRQDVVTADAQRHTRSVLSRVAVQISRPAAQVALRWVLSHPGVNSVAFGASSLRQVEENLGTVDLQLKAEDLTILNAASIPHARYPANLQQLVRGLRDPPICG